MNKGRILIFALTMRNFLVKLIFYTILIALADFCWELYMPVSKHIPYIWWIVAFFFLITILFYFISINASKGTPQGLIRSTMVKTVLRFFLYILMIVAYRFYDKSTLIPFAIGFIAHYFLFTAFEVSALLKELKKS